MLFLATSEKRRVGISIQDATVMKVAMKKFICLNKKKAKKSSKQIEMDINFFSENCSQLNGNLTLESEKFEACKQFNSLIDRPFVSIAFAANLPIFQANSGEFFGYSGTSSERLKLLFLNENSEQQLKSLLAYALTLKLLKLLQRKVLFSSSYQTSEKQLREKIFTPTEEVFVKMIVITLVILIYFWNLSHFSLPFQQREIIMTEK